MQFIIQRAVGTKFNFENKFSSQGNN